MSGRDLVRLEAFVKETVLPGTQPHTTKWRRVLEALGKADSLERTTGDVTICTREADHYDPDDRPSWKEGKPGHWNHRNASIWDDSAAYSHPHAAV
ncbi:hypothetical protein [Streptomyces sp. NPDC048636]|uniref:hypothetical protein n=1 Tax=Streptomyces sp. NPDC048636 TaxID=3155762 RepID=UPI0034454C61